jgi:DNA-binding NarL/FixJ family response regulator
MSERNAGPRPEAATSGSEPGDRTKAGTIRVAVADDNPLTRVGIRALIHATTDLKVAGEASDAESALQLISRAAADVAAVDVPMPRLGASELRGYLAEQRPTTKILVLTGLQDNAWLLELLQAGAQGYLLKYSAPAELIRAIRIVFAGGIYIDPVIASKLLISTTTGDVVPAAPLSQREITVLRFVARGFGNKEMATKLKLSIKTVQTYKARAMKKLRLQTRSDVVRYGAARGWIDDM